MLHVKILRCNQTDNYEFLYTEKEQQNIPIQVR